MNTEKKIKVYDKEQTRKKLHAIIDNMIDNREDKYDYHKIPTWRVVSPTPAMIYTAMYRLGLTKADKGFVEINYDIQKRLSADVKDLFRILSE